MISNYRVIGVTLMALAACSAEPDPSEKDSTEAAGEHVFSTQEKALRDAEQLEQSLQDAAAKRLEDIDQG